MKKTDNKAFYKSLIDRGYVQIGATLYPASQAALLSQNDIHVPKKKERALKRLKTGWIDDTLNIKNQANIIDPFVTLVLRLLGLIVWPEFYFLTDRQYRFDYAIPIAQDNLILKIAIEVNGGIWARGASGHSSGTGIARDMHKSTQAALHGWILISVQPADLCTDDTLNMIRKAIDMRINAL